VLAIMLNVSKPNGESVIKTALIINNKNDNKNEEEEDKEDKEERGIVAFFLSLLVLSLFL